MSSWGDASWFPTAPYLQSVFSSGFCDVWHKHFTPASPLLGHEPSTSSTWPTIFTEVVGGFWYIFTFLTSLHEISSHVQKFWASTGRTLGNWSTTSQTNATFSHKFCFLVSACHLPTHAAFDLSVGWGINYISEKRVREVNHQLSEKLQRRSVPVKAVSKRDA